MMLDRFRAKYFSALILFFLMFSGRGTEASLISKFLPHAKEIHKQDVFEYDLLTFRGAGKKYPMIVILHGMGEEHGWIFEQWREMAEKHEVMILTPDWRKAFVNRGQNFESLRQLVKRIAAKYPVDEKKIFLAGLSAGANMLSQSNIDSADWAGILMASYAPPANWYGSVPANKLPPLFFVYGRKDPNAQSGILEQGVETLKRQGRKVYLLIDPQGEHPLRNEVLPIIFKWVKETGKA